MIRRTNYHSDEQWEKYLSFSKNIKTPCLIIDLDIIKRKYEQMKKNFFYAKIHYAVKANPSDEIIKLLIGLGSNFDVASIYELDSLLSLGVTPEKISYGNTIKKSQDIQYCYKKGVRLFVTDCLNDLNNIAKYAPGSKFLVRLLIESETADWPLSKKFGCHPDTAKHLIIEGKAQNLVPYGISFHVGSQQRDIGEWIQSLAIVKYLFNAVSSQGIELKMINLGGGFPANYLKKTQSLSMYASEIHGYLKDCFNDNLPDIILEPGRGLVADAGVLMTEVIMVEKKNPTDLHKWVYLDVGKFNGLIETIDESIQYPIVTDVTNDEKPEYYVLAGPTCDSYDILYQKTKYRLPNCLKEGDRLYFLTTGAYTNSYASVGFNGFPPIQCYFIPESKRELKMLDLPLDIREKLVVENHIYLKPSEALKQEIENLFFVADKFFSLPLKEKEKFAANSILTGFRKQGIEYSASADNPDLNETFYYKPVDESLLSFQNDNFIFNAFFEQICKTYNEYDKLTELILKSLGESYNDNYKKIETNLHTWLQINYYQPYLNQREFLQDEHEDGHILTFIVANDKGLEIKNKNGNYQQANYGVDNIIVYGGELMSLLTGYDIQALYHRVRNFQDIQKRISIIYFVNPNLEQNIDPWVKNKTNEKVNILKFAEELPLKYGLPKL
jgi:ornithine decarboxylase